MLVVFELAPNLLRVMPATRPPWIPQSVLESFCSSPPLWIAILLFCLSFLWAVFQTSPPTAPIAASVWKGSPIPYLYPLPPSQIHCFRQILLSLFYTTCHFDFSTPAFSLAVFLELSFWNWSSSFFWMTLVTSISDLIARTLFWVSAFLSCSFFPKEYPVSRFPHCGTSASPRAIWP